MVKPPPYRDESEAQALAKFRNDLSVRRRFLQAAVSNPCLVTCSMVSMMDVTERLKVPGQSKWLVWLSGDFSVKGNSFGIEFWDPKLGHQKWWSFIEHPVKTLAALREALAGKVKKHQAIMSSVLERLNKLCAEFQWREILAGRPVIVLDDNTGSVASANAHYSSNMHLQAMELASGLRQSVDETRQVSFYCNTENMSWMDLSSRRKTSELTRMNKELEEMGEEQWQYKPPDIDPLKIVQWLDEHLDNTEMPMLDQLLDELAIKCVKQSMPECSLDPAVIASEPDLRWQRRVEAAAEPIPHWMGSFGPMAYSTEHLRRDPVVGKLSMMHTHLTEANCRLAASSMKWVLVDAYSGGCGVTVSAIQAGVFVKTAFEVEKEEIGTFEKLTGQIILGPIDYKHFEPARIPRSHLWWSS